MRESRTAFPDAISPVLERSLKSEITRQGEGEVLGQAMLYRSKRFTVTLRKTFWGHFEAQEHPA
jgi:hypothetical protein